MKTDTAEWEVLSGSGSTTTKALPPVVMVAKGVQCSHGGWVSGTRMTGSTEQDFMTNYMECLTPLREDLRCSTEWFGISTKSGRCYCVNARDSCKSRSPDQFGFIFRVTRPVTLAFTTTTTLPVTLSNVTSGKNASTTGSASNPDTTRVGDLPPRTSTSTTQSHKSRVWHEDTEGADGPATDSHTTLLDTMAKTRTTVPPDTRKDITEKDTGAEEKEDADDLGPATSAATTTATTTAHPLDTIAKTTAAFPPAARKDITEKDTGAEEKEEADDLGPATSTATTTVDGATVLPFDTPTTRIADTTVAAPPDTTEDITEKDTGAEEKEEADDLGPATSTATTTVDGATVLPFDTPTTRIADTTVAAPPDTTEDITEKDTGAEEKEDADDLGPATSTAGTTSALPFDTIATTIADTTIAVLPDTTEDITEKDAGENEGAASTSATIPDTTTVLPHSTAAATTTTAATIIAVPPDTTKDITEKDRGAEEKEKAHDLGPATTATTTAHPFDTPAQDEPGADDSPPAPEERPFTEEEKGAEDSPPASEPDTVSPYRAPPAASPPSFSPGEEAEDSPPASEERKPCETAAPCMPRAPEGHPDMVSPYQAPSAASPPSFSPGEEEIHVGIHNYSKNCFSPQRCVQNLVDGQTCYFDDPSSPKDRRLDALWNVSGLGTAWVEFDLYKVRHVQTLVLYGQNEQAHCGREAVSFDLLYQNAAGKYQTALSVKDTYKYPSAGPVSCQQSEEEQCPNPTVRTHRIKGEIAAARFWKLKVTGAYPHAEHYGFMEVKFFGRHIDPEIYPLKLKDYSQNCVSDERCAQNLVDGQTCFQPKVANDALWSIGALGKAWVVFDLLAPCRVSSMIVFGQNCASELTGFELLYEKDNTYQTALSVADSGGTSACRQTAGSACPNPAEYHHYIPGGTAARLWKMIMKKGSPKAESVGIMEVKFHGKRVLDPVISPVSINDDSKNCVSDLRCASNLVDGKTCFESGVAFDAMWSNRHLGWAWITFDLQRPYKVTTLVTYGQNQFSHCAHEATGFDLEFERGGKYHSAMSTWDVYSDITTRVHSCQQQLARECPNPSVHYSFVTGGFVSRFWKLVINRAYSNATNPTFSSGTFGLMEVKFLGVKSEEERQR